MKILCTRKACSMPCNKAWKHTQTGEYYCIDCAKLINSHNHGLVIRTVVSRTVLPVGNRIAVITPTSAKQ